MTSVMVLAWMSVTAAILRSTGPGGAGTGLAHLAVQTTVLLALMVEAGSVESGRGSKLRRPLQVLATLAFMVFLGLFHRAELCFLREQLALLVCFFKS